MVKRKEIFTVDNFESSMFHEHVSDFEALHAVGLFGHRFYPSSLEWELKGNEQLTKTADQIVNVILYISNKIKHQLYEYTL